MRSLISCAALLMVGFTAAGQQVAHGLVGTYFRGSKFEEKVLTRTDPTLDFNWDYRKPAPGMAEDDYSVRWTGFIQAPVTGTYTFIISTDDGMRVWLGDQMMFNEWRPQVPSNFRRKVKLVAGQVYQLKVEYYQLNYQARASLYWQRPDEPDKAPGPIPNSALFVRQPPTPKPPTAAPAVAAVSKPADAVLVKPEPKPETRPEPKPEPVRPTPSPTVTKAVPPPPETRPERESKPTSKPEPVLASLGTLAKGTTLEIKELYFEQSKARLLPNSGPAIERLAAALRDNPGVKLEIAGHTDNVGDPVKNQRLSEERAQRIRELLVLRGIGTDRLTAVGYGGTRPVADNNDPAQRPRNRRVEITVQ